MASYDIQIEVSVDADNLMDAIFDIDDALGEGFRHFENMDADVTLVERTHEE